MKRSAPLAAAVAVLVLPLAACAGQAAADDRLAVVAQAYPFAWVTERVGGDLVAVTTLVPAGADVHTLEVSPQQVTLLADADLVVTSSGAAPAVDDAVASAGVRRVVDAAEVIDVLPVGEHAEEEHADQEGAEDDHDHGTFDPHTWLAIDQLPALVDAVAAALTDAAPQHAQTFAAAAAELAADLRALDEEYRTGLAACERDTVVVSHPAFGYLTAAYGLEQVGVSGLDEDTEPSPARLAQVADVATQSGATTIFFPDTSSPTVADALADDLGLRTAVLSSILGAADGEDYLSLARANLAALQTGLGCSS